MDLYKTTRSVTLEMLQSAYRQGIFPMADIRRSVVTWHRPDPRAILPLDGFHVSRSLARTLRRGGFEVTLNCDFQGVMRACAERNPTWISEEFIRVYSELQKLGQAHSVEVWVSGTLAAGVYGVHLGGAFFAESMFHRVTDLSKVALLRLTEHMRERGFTLLDVQYLTPHLARLGAVEIPLREYLRRLKAALSLPCKF